MTPSKPYLIRAIFEWINDNHMTPYLMVNAEMEGVQVPRDYVEDGTIVLNISPQACRGLHIENDRVVFSARFGEVALQVYVPPTAVMAIYAKENGRGMVFGQDEGDGGDILNDGDDDDLPPMGGDSSSSQPSRGKPKLKVVK